MKIVIAPDSFKESLTSQEVATAIESGFKTVFPHAEFIKLPIADGGEGTVDSLVAATQGHIEHLIVTGPIGEQIDSFYGITGDGQCAIIEMAAASGLMLVPTAQRNPMEATSYGTGELITSALDKGIRHLILGIGGSATVDGGIGMLQALGVRFMDSHLKDVPFGGHGLERLAHIDISELDPRIHECKIDIACDVNNPLIGEFGAAQVFGPQKGATPEMVERLDRALTNYADVIKHELNIESHYIHGGGAAGGMGVAAKVFLKGRLRSGIDIVIEAIGLEKELNNCQLVITGEGCIDGQTTGGKAPIGIAKLAQRYNIPVIGFAGILSEGAEVVHQHGLDAIFSILPRLSKLDDALYSAGDNLYNCARNVAEALQIGQKLTPAYMSSKEQ
ncbi:glycerate kinase [Pragia fontium]|uniref:Glycerate kinase n=1 Tax=Pragia fontium DSM 5563 = ATCC 49100 TaxID=1122977 RepID=A0AAJ4W815_9GAMM|nr:glycerate kinase [Pragia fontium]SFC08330.1 glycerate kinase [Pragia fontium DSM 5563 = ATCC 49100]SUB81466.1 Glycerate kinase [Pragia fontium]VEJ53771.1 Glycerate kinase [Pragia fontium]